ncbi:Glycosyl hydrolases family 17 [Musa troglodytarum]|uniref:Glycosyl hydrolases family 17 n=1 Tax=Musa troglodytarum TaxID=320322 RepID=A0A9E7FWX3_9LILI|nr:Glycosyl hydrolases family 17 [Musa troglodytarum]
MTSPEMSTGDVALEATLLESYGDVAEASTTSLEPREHRPWFWQHRPSLGDIARAFDNVARASLLDEQHPKLPISASGKEARHASKAMLVVHIKLAGSLLGAAENVYNALDGLKLADDIEVSMPHSAAVFANSFPPSSCTFREDVLVYMRPILDFFSKIDAAYAALEAAGYGKMEVRVSETGWASDGDENEAGDTVQNARTYNFNLRKRLFKKKGTPRRPKMPGPSSEKHYGLFKADESISYDIDLTSLKPSGASLSLLSLTLRGPSIRLGMRKIV